MADYRRHPEDGEAVRSRREQHRHERQVLRNRYATRFLSCLAASLLAMIAAAHLPLHKQWSPVGWYVIRPSESITVDVVKRSGTRPKIHGAPITRFDSGNLPAPPVGDTPERNPLQAEEKERTSQTGRPLKPLAGRRIFDVTHQMPTIVGGMGAYYIHIEYPEEALNKGIQGRLVLSFIVETDGNTTHVEVLHPLHPACDSAAVRALRQTKFVPGRQDGEAVPVRMRIPVRFKIVERDDGLAAANGASG